MNLVGFHKGYTFLQFVVSLMVFYMINSTVQFFLWFNDCFHIQILSRFAVGRLQVLVVFMLMLPVTLTEWIYDALYAFFFIIIIIDP